MYSFLIFKFSSNLWKWSSVHVDVLCKKRSLLCWINRGEHHWTEMSNLESDYNGHNRNLLSIFSAQFTCAITVKPQNMGHVYGRLLCTKINFKTLSSFRSESSLMFIVLLIVYGSHVTSYYFIGGACITWPSMASRWPNFGTSFS